MRSLCLCVCLFAACGDDDPATSSDTSSSDDVTTAATDTTPDVPTAPRLAVLADERELTADETLRLPPPIGGGSDHMADITLMNAGIGNLLVSYFDMQSEAILALVPETRPPDDGVHLSAGQRYPMRLAGGAVAGTKLRVALTWSSAQTPETIFVFNVEWERPNSGLGGPTSIAFGEIEPGVQVTETLLLHNYGATALTLERFELSGDPSFTFAAGVDGLPLVIAPDGEAPVTITYQGTSTEPVHAQLVLFTDDPSTPNGTTVGVSVNE